MIWTDEADVELLKEFQLCKFRFLVENAEVQNPTCFSERETLPYFSFNSINNFSSMLRIDLDEVSLESKELGLLNFIIHID